MFADLSRAGRGALWAVPVMLAGCGAVYPELSPPVRNAPQNQTMEPPPPDDLLFVRFVKAEIPQRTRDGRAWDSVGNALPDVFAKFTILFHCKGYSQGHLIISHDTRMPIRESGLGK